ncbi:uncharacterized protein HMPREF1541_07363 [Cyphellophora europaea CBS 101466]|uniref:3-keto-steroid reductase n=1 Tax=Cyphellophora europaea (strain CBS 101466) TaxID=1220924 RepID=W2RN25_CYPE1|nr:uncharacterized protein HMPREF1541_07363 [Cyphellophora europaea CBS 101466]ETN37740.1 hypothetical protein HMPREF1541_07363 [Cyphellophora europaea CBS 101466]
MEPYTYHILVTGANSGLGLGICTRLIDDFLRTKQASDTLTLLFTTRSTRKGSDTLKILRSHVDSIALSSSNRIHLRSEIVELTSLLSVRGLAQRLIASDVPQLDAVILNAGIGGWTGLDWPLAIGTVLVDLRRATTWPTFKLGAVGVVAKPQLPPVDGEKLDEPPLGEVFCANVFGHYMLAHWLMPLLWTCPSSSPAKIVWVSSIEASARHYNPADHQGLRSNAAYEHSKRLTDYLALTQGQSKTRTSLSSYLHCEAVEGAPKRPQISRPTIHTTQPGILTTTIIDLYWIVHQAYLLAIFIARWLGSPWATVNPYPAAISAVWLALVSRSELELKEKTGGGKAIKWGSAIDRLARSRVESTDVEGWGFNGSGKAFADTWWGGPSWWRGGHIGRPQDAKDATLEDVEAFIDEGAKVWAKMEQLRQDWEQRLLAHDKLQQK